MSPEPEPEPRGSDAESRLADLAAELQRADRVPDLAALARRHGIAEPEAADCLRALRSLRNAVEPPPPEPAATGSGEPVPLDPVLPAEYELLGELGRGGMGVVFRVRHRALDRVVALKLLRPGEQALQDLLQRFEVEARSLARLRHPHIVGVHDVGRAGGHVYYTMDLIEGTSLDKALTAPMSPSRAVRLMLQVVSAIQHTHEHGVIHRDLKPANILLDQAGDAFVADFGLARDINLGSELTRSGQVLGTPAYMSPEAIRGDHARVGERSDVWALGAVLYECLTGCSPFGNRPLAETLHAVLHDDPAPPRRRDAKVPRDLELVCLKALAKDPEERYATARALYEDLERFQQGHPVLAQRPGLGRRLSRWLQRNRAAALSALLAAAAVLALAWLLPARRPTPDVVDTMLQAAVRHGNEGRWQVAVETYDHAATLLGTDRDRSTRLGAGMTGDALESHVWRGILWARLGLGRQLAERGNLSGAIAVLEDPLGRQPPALVDAEVGEAKGLLCAWQLLLGDLDAAVARLEQEARRPQTEPATQTTRLMRMVRLGLRTLDPVWQDPGHVRWPEAGAWLARVCQLEADGVLRTSLEDLWRSANPTGAWIAAWAHAGRLGGEARTRLLARLRALVLGHAGTQQWGTLPRGQLTALLRLAQADALDEPARRVALDLVCAACDAPWRPAGAVDGAALAAGRRALQTAELPRAAGYAERVAWAIEGSGAAGPAPRVDPVAWLSAHTGAPADTDWPAWWADRRQEHPRVWLERSLGTVPSRAEEAADHFARREGRARAWLHHWLWLGQHEASAAPLWPPGESEPANLVASWKHGLARPDLGYRVHLGFTELDSDDRRSLASSVTSQPLTWHAPLRTWVGGDSLGWGGLGSWSELRAGVPAWQLYLPGVDDVLGRGDRPTHRLDLLGQLQWNDGVELQWTARAQGLRTEARTSGPTAPVRPGESSLWFVDAVPRGHEGEQFGPWVVLVGLSAEAAPEAGPQPPMDWHALVQQALRTAARAAEAAPDLETLARALALLPGQERSPLDLVARLPWPDQLPRLRTLDATLRGLRADPDRCAALVRRHGAGDSATRHLRGLLARMLAARLLAGDATALAEPEFTARLAEADAGLELSPWWWHRALRQARNPELRALAASRLLAAPLPPPLAARLGRASAAELAELPAELRAVAAAAAAERSRARTGSLLPLGGLCAALLLAAALGALGLWRQRQGRAASIRPALWLVLLGLVALLVRARFGQWSLLPAPVGAGAVAAGSLLLFAVRRSGAAACTAAGALLAAAAVAWADAGDSPYVEAAGSLLLGISLGGVALQVAGAARGLRAWLAIPAVACLVGATASAAILALLALLRGTPIESLADAVEGSRLAGTLRVLASAGTLWLVLLVAAAAALGPRPMPPLPARR